MPGCWACPRDRWVTLGKAWPRRSSGGVGHWGERAGRWGGVAGLVSSSEDGWKLGGGDHEYRPLVLLVMARGLFAAPGLLGLGLHVACIVVGG